jgi:hypothetical protein
MSNDQTSFAVRVIGLYLDDPDTPDMPSTSDWDIARGLAERGISFDTVQLAFRLAFIRRRSSPSGTPPPIRSLAYFRAVALNLTAEEQHPAYAEYVRQLYQQLRPSPASTPHENRTAKPESRGFS